MDRKTLDKLLSATGAVLAAVLLLGGILLVWAGSFVNDQVSSQLSAQDITMPEGGALESLSDEDRKELEPFAGQPLDGARQAKAFADHYIYAHMMASSDGRTYQQVSAEYNALDDKTTEEAQELGNLRRSLLDGNTLRGTLLTAYAFGTIGEIALIASGVAFGGAALLGVLSVLGFRHAKKAEVKRKADAAAA
ncbi:hypothetical protein SAMN06309944_2116 [Micrococcales bacterium KH10]|nr:hypothetical protein SAMN06309944_2116 [Micrococcales bacterium KH10]